MSKTADFISTMLKYADSTHGVNTCFIQKNCWIVIPTVNHTGFEHRGHNKTIQKSVSFSK